MNQRRSKITREDMTKLLLKDDLEAPLELSKLGSTTAAELEEQSKETFRVDFKFECLKCLKSSHLTF